MTISLAQGNFKQVFNEKTRGTTTNIKIDVTDDLGNEGYLPVSIVKGKTDGPVFTIVAGVHGFEYPPIVATQELMQEIDVDKLAGILIFIPIANRASFYTRTPYMNPQDKTNLNGAFPGDASGSITQRMAYSITEKIIPVSDVFLDIHGGDACEDLIPFICYYNNQQKPEQTRKAKELSENSGFEYVVSYPYTLKDEDPAKYVFKQAVQDGKTALSIEAGKLGNVQEESVILIKTGVYNMLAQMNMYDGPKTTPKPDLIKLNYQTYIRSNEKGIFYSPLKAGDSVKKGDIVGRTTDEFGKTITEYKATSSGVILYKLATPPINKGDTVMCISEHR
ncbi:succinylglutamate desuccinylase/aspartoacylase family protein [Zobellia roscoffensis]|uniref:succinylglutamate desuccinylase/aspartoacylase family protein n=1 Tax=Zobellia roscoffensis TaxID=2779508 RepID=UPI00188ACBB9|nr:succinylglutamate desuccinylase/aspartoacylase family protein [Zobellia roscoffensis]